MASNLKPISENKKSPNVFFGKISKNYDPQQIKDGYYEAPRDSTWFGDLEIGDYVYLIGGDKIQFWQAEQWDKKGTRMNFKILNNDLEISVNDFIALDFFELTKSLMVLTVRQSPKAFFKIDLTKEYPIEQLVQSDFYKNEKLYRKIVIVKNNQVDINSQDIQLLYQSGNLSLFHSSFFDKEVFDLFKDNLEYVGKGSRNKDKTLKLIRDGLKENKESIFSRSEINLRSFYDAFFCHYYTDTDTDTDTDTVAEVQDSFISEVVTSLKKKKNLILQGAPGTGKTYATAELSVALCNGIDAAPNNRKDLMAEYNKLINEHRIAFTTFHESLDYEEFVEGFKPEISGENMLYKVKPGIFRDLCDKAGKTVLLNNFNIRDNATIWKVSLLKAGDNYVRDDCLRNNRIRIGWDQYGKNIDGNTNYTVGGKIILDAFLNKMQIGDIVLSCYNSRVVDAIGIITGDYEWNDKLGEYGRCRNVNWLVKDISEDIYDLNNETAMTSSTVYRLNNLSIEDVLSILEKYNVTKNDKPYVLIIDEINRGNVSKIFGELITLLETDKRLGEINEIKVTLPYSQQKFGVPANLYIIGTMNTADRSLGYIDYAIRRRFSFATLKADKNVIKNYYSEKQELRDKVLNLFDDIKSFIDIHIQGDLLSDDLMLGHSYFLADDLSEMKMNLKFDIFPLILEYDKDGILKTDAKKMNEYFDKWMNIL